MDASETADADIFRKLHGDRHNTFLKMAQRIVGTRVDAMASAIEQRDNCE